MSGLKNGCCTSSAAIKQAAMDRLDDLVLGPWYTDSKESGEPARVRHRIKILKATNEFDAAELLKISHSCNACNRDARTGGTKQTCAADLAEAHINDTKDKLKRMKVIVTRINNRNWQVQKLEHHLKTYGTILESLNIVLPGDGTGYSYRIDPINGISLVIQGPSTSDTENQKRARPTNLLDSDIPWALSPTLTPAPAPAPAPAATPARNHTQIKKKAVANATETRLKIPNLQICDSEEEHDAAYREHVLLAGSRGRIDHTDNGGDGDSNSNGNGGNGDSNSNGNGSIIPLIFEKGICRPPPSLSPPRSRMVVFSDLHPATTYAELLDKVRGGPVLHVARADRTTVVVSFVTSRDARAYVDYVNDPSRQRRRGHRLTIRGVAPRVTLVATPSYPLRTELMVVDDDDDDDVVAHRGGVVVVVVTRCLEITNVSCRDLDAFFTTRKLWAFTETRDIEYVVVNIDDQQHGGGGGDDDEMLEDALVEEWIAVDHNDKYRQEEEEEEEEEPKQTPKPPPNTNIARVFRVSFRDVSQAERARGLIARHFQGCGVRYAPDRCAGPLEELDG
ncbi:hypothetical protein F4782DRAFT_549721 [Xylaria castorea]|nr:hypothetical protein F4782DRAFT_549721 [Xylaria castorea]